MICFNVFFHSSSYPFFSLFLLIFESFFNLPYIFIDFKVGNKKKRLLIYLGLSSSWCISWKRPNANMFAKTAYVFLSISACSKHTSFTAASNEEIWSKKAMSLPSFPAHIMLCIWNLELRYFIYLLSPKEA